MKMKDETVDRLYTKWTQIVKWHERMERWSNEPIEAHVGTANQKTGSANEGTLPLVTCTPDARKRGGCGGFCYASRLANCYTDYCEHLIRNTVMRRRNPTAYYLSVFQKAQSIGADMVRLNESGDFEDAEQVRSAWRVAESFPMIRVVTYCHRPELVNELKDAPLNVSVRFSMAMSSATPPEGVKVTAVTDEWRKVNCPAQLWAEYNKRHGFAKGDDGYVEWHCADCAMRRIGCAGDADCVFFHIH